MRTLFLLIAITLLSCTRETNTNSLSVKDSQKTESSYDFEVVLKFINDYVSFCNSESYQANDTNWIKNNSLLSNNFKSSFYKLINTAYKNDPELGLGFDPIFDAQDYPEKGFEIVNRDTLAGYVTVKSKDWPEFHLVLKVINENGKSLIDGSGVINIPTDKKAKR